jgi:chorismate mutase
VRGNEPPGDRAMRIREPRHKIEVLDRQMVHVLNRRAEYSLAIGRLKRPRLLPLFHHERELEVAGNVRRANAGPLSARGRRKA